MSAARSLSVMIGACMPLEEALKALSGGVEDDRLASILERVARDVGGGGSLSDALAAHGDTFEPFVHQLVRAGEVAGTLADSLERVAGHLERRAALRRRLRLALAYPAFVLTVALGAVAFLLTFVVPTFADLFADFGAELPLPTLAVLKASNLVTEYALLWMLLLAGGTVALRAAARTPRGRLLVDRLRLHLPFVGTMHRRSEVAQWSRTLSGLIGGGVPLEHALEIAAASAGNVHYRACIEEARQVVRDGGRLTLSLQRSGLFPAVALQLVAAGEETSSLADTLAHLADYYEEEVDRLAEAQAALLEPVLIVLVGALLGGILVAMYLPMFDLSQFAG